jgi:energy-coupling factor transporter transmembrane protein EcfT
MKKNQRNEVLARLAVFVLYIISASMFITQAVPKEWYWLAIILFCILWQQFVKKD